MFSIEIWVPSHEACWRAYFILLQSRDIALHVMMMVMMNSMLFHNDIVHESVTASYNCLHHHCYFLSIHLKFITAGDKNSLVH